MPRTRTPNSATPAWSRELSSVANQLGMKRTLCEVYGAGGWDLRFEDMKRIGDWLEVLGVNTLDQHLSYVTHPRRPQARPSAVLLLPRAVVGGLSRLGGILRAPLAGPFPGGADQPRAGPRTDHHRLDVSGRRAQSSRRSASASSAPGDGAGTAQVEYDIGDEDVIARHGAGVEPAMPGEAGF